MMTNARYTAEEMITAAVQVTECKIMTVTAAVIENAMKKSEVDFLRNDVHSIAYDSDNNVSFCIFYEASW